MNGYVSNTTLDDVAAWLRSGQLVVLATHTRPDGDAVGSALALARALDRVGVRSELWLAPPVPEEFESIIEPNRIHLLDERTLPPDDADRVVLTDTGAVVQLGPLYPWLKSRRDITCVIDHHRQGDNLARWQIVEPGASAASEIVDALIQRLGVPIDETIATPLYMGIATDTGWFRFSNTSAEAFRLAAKYLDTGVQHTHLFRLIEQTHHASRLRLLARALTSLETIRDGRVVLLGLSQHDYEDCGAEFTESHGFSDFPHCVGDVEVVCLVTELNPRESKLSFRSKDGPNAIDVNAIAMDLGGGGHARAAGARITASFDEAKGIARRVLARV